MSNSTSCPRLLDRRLVPRTSIYNPRLLVGLPHDVEVGVNFPIYHYGDCDPSSLGYIQPNIKWKFYKDDRGPGGQCRRRVEYPAQ